MTTQPLSITIDGVAGNDNNDGSPSSPLATLVEFERRIPLDLEHDVLGTVVRAGTYVCPSFRTRLYRNGQIYVRATPVTTVLASTAALTGSSASVIKSSGLTVDQFTNMYIHMLTGAAAGDYRLVKTTSATDITPVRNFTAAVAAGDLYEIVQPLVQLDTSSYPILRGPPCSQATVVLPFQPGLNFENFGFMVPSGSGALPIEGRVAFWRCYATQVYLGAALRSNTQILLGVDSLLNAGVIGLSATGPQRVYGGASKAYLGAGLYYPYTDEPEAGGFFGYVNAPNGLYIRNSPFTQLHGGSIGTDHLTCEGTGTFVILGGDPTTQLLVQGVHSSCLRVWQDAYCQLSRCQIIGLGGTNVGALVQQRGILDVLGLSTAVQISGGQYGVRAQLGAAQCWLHEGAPAITGGTNNFAVGLTANVTNSIPNVGDMLAPSSNDDGSRIIRIE